MTSLSLATRRAQPQLSRVTRLEEQLRRSISTIELDRKKGGMFYSLPLNWQTLTSDRQRTRCDSWLRVTPPLNARYHPVQVIYANPHPAGPDSTSPASLTRKSTNPSSSPPAPTSSSRPSSPPPPSAPSSSAPPSNPSAPASLTRSITKDGPTTSASPTSASPSRSTR